MSGRRKRTVDWRAAAAEMERKRPRKPPAPSRRTGVVHLLVAVAIGVAAAAGAIAVTADLKDEQTDQTLGVDLGDRLGEAIAALREDGVYVASDGRALVDEDGERAIEAAVAAQEVPTYVVVWGPEPQLGVDGLIAEDLLERELPDEDGFLFLWEGPQEGDVLDLGPNGGSPDYNSALDFVGDPATTLVDAVSSVSRDDIYEDDGDGGDYWGGIGGGSVLGLMLGATVVTVLLGLAKLLALTTGRRRLLPGGWRLRAEERP